jgi:hypothetical protein
MVATAGQPTGTGAYPGQWQQNQPPQNTCSHAGPYAGQWQQHPAPQSAGTPTGTPAHGQFGGGFQRSRYGGLGAFPAAIITTKKRSKKPLLVGGIGVLIVAGAGVAAWLLGAFSGNTPEQKSLQNGVSKVLTQSYGEQDMRAVQCVRKSRPASPSTAPPKSVASRRR